jgi:transcription antitermination factor NusG
MSADLTPSARGYSPGDGVRVLDGTFAGFVGRVATAEEVRELEESYGRSYSPPAPGCVTVLLVVFGRPVAIDLRLGRIERLG